MKTKYIADICGGMNGRLPERYRLVSIEILPDEYCLGRFEWKIMLLIKNPWWKGGEYTERTFVGSCFEWKEITTPNKGWFPTPNGWLDPYDKKIDFLNAIVSYEAQKFIHLDSE
jgi:hypothetical protein